MSDILPDLQEYISSKIHYDSGVAADEIDPDVVPYDDALAKKMAEFMAGGSPALPPMVSRWLGHIRDDRLLANANFGAGEGGLIHRMITGLGSILEQVVVGIGSALAGIVQVVLRPALRSLISGRDAEIHDETNRLVKNMTSAGILDPKAAENLDALFETSGYASNVLPLIAAATMVKGALTAVFNTAGGDFAKRMNGVFTPNAPDQAQLIRLRYLGTLDPTEYAVKMSHLGYDEPDATLMAQAVLQLLPPDVIRTLRLRDKLTDEQVNEELGKAGFSPERIDGIKEVWNVTPGIQDLIFMYGKEAFEPKIIEKYGYMDEFPEEGVEYAKRHGLDRFWLQKYWAAHWNPPSITQGYEMLHRDVIGPKELDDLFKTVETPPYWREKLTQIAYSPFTRVDVRRMSRAGELEPEEVFQAYKDIGYDDEKAQKLLDWTVAENVSASRELTRSQIERYYRAGLAKPGEAEGMLVALGYDKSEADFITALIDFDNEAKEVEEDIGLIGERYVFGSLERGMASVELNQLGLPAAKVNRLLDRWNLKRLADAALPSKSDLDKWIKAGVIGVAAYSKALETLRYSASDIRNYVEHLRLTSSRVAEEIRGKPIE